MPKAWVSFTIKHDILGRKLPELVPMPKPTHSQKQQRPGVRPSPGPVHPLKAKSPAATSQTPREKSTTRPKPAWASMMDGHELKKLPPTLASPAPPPEKQAWTPVSSNVSTLPAHPTKPQAPTRPAWLKDNGRRTEVSSPPVRHHDENSHLEWITVNRSNSKIPHAPPSPSKVTITSRPPTSASTPERLSSVVFPHNPVKEGKSKKQRAPRPSPAVPAWP